MIHILECVNEYQHTYFFISPDYVSSDFDFLDQLIDVGFDDTEKVSISMYGDDQSSALATLLICSDLYHLATVDSLDNLYDQYPELFL